MKMKSIEEKSYEKRRRHPRRMKMAASLSKINVKAK
jgi:hypothetical protein